MPIFALCILAVVTLAGAAIALSMDSRAANNLQIAADEAALSGATAFLNSASPRADDRIAAATQAAEAAAQANADYALANMDIGAVTEDAYGQKTVIEVALKFTPANPAAQIAGRNAGIEIEREAAASATWGFPLCVLGLQGSSVGLSTAGQAELIAENCIIWTNSTGSRSMEFTGGRATTKYFCAAGNAYVASASVTPRPHEKCDAIPDPLSSWKAPLAASNPVKLVSASSRNYTVEQVSDLVHLLYKTIDDPELKDASKAIRAAISAGEPIPDSEAAALHSALLGLLSKPRSKKTDKLIDQNGVYMPGTLAAGLHFLEVAQIAGIIDNLPLDLYSTDTYTSGITKTLSPGTYAGLDISGGHVKLKPGVYHIVGAPLIVRRRATLSGDGVTIVLHGDYATFSVLDQARISLTAPTSGETAGFAVAENRRATLTRLKPERSRLTGSGKIEMVGTIYLPRQQFSITGEGAADQASPLLQLVAYTIDLKNKGGLKINFDPSRTEVPMTIQPSREARLIR